MEKYLFINPDARSNADLPNIALAYTATHYRARVIDLNTVPSPANRFLGTEAEILGVSFQSRSTAEAERVRQAYLQRYPAANAVSLSADVDVQCCYPFLQWDQSIALPGEFSDSFPLPDYELFDSFPVFQANWSRGRWPYAIMTSRGCPFACTYCASHLRSWRARSAGNCVDELRSARERWQIRSFTILDDCFNFNRDRVLDFCRLVRPLHLEWFCTNGLRADRFDAEMARAMADAGCTTVGFGIESADPTVLKGIRKGETIGQIESALDAAKMHFGSVSGFFIIGLPGSSYEADMHTVKWAVSQGIYAHFSVFVPSGNSLAADARFYGNDLAVLGDAYPPELQTKVYSLTRGLTWGGADRSLPGILRSRLWILTDCGPGALAGYLRLDARKVARGIARRLGR